MNKPPPPPPPPPPPSQRPPAPPPPPPPTAHVDQGREEKDIKPAIITAPSPQLFPSLQEETAKTLDNEATIESNPIEEPETQPQSIHKPSTSPLSVKRKTDIDPLEEQLAEQSEERPNEVKISDVKRDEVKEEKAKVPAISARRLSVFSPDSERRTSIVGSEHRRLSTLVSQRRKKGSLIKTEAAATSLPEERPPSSATAPTKKSRRASVMGDVSMITATSATAGSATAAPVRRSSVAGSSTPKSRRTTITADRKLSVVEPDLQGNKEGRRLSVINLDDPSIRNSVYHARNSIFSGDEENRHNTFNWRKVSVMATERAANTPVSPAVEAVDLNPSADPKRSRDIVGDEHQTARHGTPSSAETSASPKTVFSSFTKLFADVPSSISNAERSSPSSNGTNHPSIALNMSEAEFTGKVKETLHELKEQLTVQLQSFANYTMRLERTSSEQHLQQCLQFLGQAAIETSERRSQSGTSNLLTWNDVRQILRLNNMVLQHQSTVMKEDFKTGSNSSDPVPSSSQRPSATATPHSPASNPPPSNDSTTPLPTPATPATAPSSAGSGGVLGETESSFLAAKKQFLLKNIEIELTKPKKLSQQRSLESATNSFTQYMQQHEQLLLHYITIYDQFLQEFISSSRESIEEERAALSRLFSAQVQDHLHPLLEKNFLKQKNHLLHLQQQLVQQHLSQQQQLLAPFLQQWRSNLEIMTAIQQQFHNAAQSGHHSFQVKQFYLSKIDQALLTVYEQIFDRLQTDAIFQEKLRHQEDLQRVKSKVFQWKLDYKQRLEDRLNYIEIMMNGYYMSSLEELYEELGQLQALNSHYFLYQEKLHYHFENLVYKHEHGKVSNDDMTALKEYHMSKGFSYPSRGPTETADPVSAPAGSKKESKLHPVKREENRNILAIGTRTRALAVLAGLGPEETANLLEEMFAVARRDFSAVASNSNQPLPVSEEMAEKLRLASSASRSLPATRNHHYHIQSLKKPATTPSQSSVPPPPSSTSKSKSRNLSPLVIEHNSDADNEEEAEQKTVNRKPFSSHSLPVPPRNPSTEEVQKPAEPRRDESPISEPSKSDQSPSSSKRPSFVEMKKASFSRPKDTSPSTQPIKKILKPPSPEPKASAETKESVFQFPPSTSELLPEGIASPRSGAKKSASFAPTLTKIFDNAEVVTEAAPPAKIGSDQKNQLAALLSKNFALR